MRRLEKDAPEVAALDLSPGDLATYPLLWLRPNGEVCALHQLMMHWTVCIGLHSFGYEDRYCYANPVVAAFAFDVWDGETGDPEGWHRHIRSGRRRENGDPATEVVRF